MVGSISNCSPAVWVNNLVLAESVTLKSKQESNLGASSDNELTWAELYSHQRVWTTSRQNRQWSSLRTQQIYTLWKVHWQTGCTWPAAWTQTHLQHTVFLLLHEQHYSIGILWGITCLCNYWFYSTHKVTMESTNLNRNEVNSVVKGL